MNVIKYAINIIISRDFTFLYKLIVSLMRIIKAIRLKRILKKSLSPVWLLTDFCAYGIKRHSVTINIIIKINIEIEYLSFIFIIFKFN